MKEMKWKICSAIERCRQEGPFLKLLALPKRYNALFPAAFTFAQRAFNSLDLMARTAALTFLLVFFLISGAGAEALTVAQRFLAAAAILSSPRCPAEPALRSSLGRGNPGRRSQKSYQLSLEFLDLFSKGGSLVKLLCG